MKLMTAALRKLHRPSTGQVLRAALEVRNSAVPHYLNSVRQPAKGTTAEPSKPPTVQTDWGEFGRV